jgi:hypothetical protein
MIRQRHRPWDWEVRLAEHFERWRGRPFAWGRSDCVQFVAPWVGYLTGNNDLAGEYRGAYRSARGAARWLDGRALADVVRIELGDPSPIGILRRGDVVLYDGAFALNPGIIEALGICDGAAARFLGKDGDVVTVPLNAETMIGWRVGD